MIFTEDNKAFVKIFVPYYRLWTTESYERIAWQKRKYVWIGQPITKLLKKGMSKRTHGVAYRRLYERRLFELKLVCW